MKRARAPGGGRKPKHGKAVDSPSSVRIPRDVRQQLENSASRKKASGQKNWSLSDEINFRLRRDLSRERHEQRDPAARALCYVLAETISMVAANAVVSDEHSGWRSDPFAFQSIRLAFDRILQLIAPDGPAERKREKTPFGLFGETIPGHKTPWLIGGDTPAAVAENVAAVILVAMQREGQQAEATRVVFASNTPTSVQSDFDSDMAKAWRDLRRSPGGKK